MPFKNLADRRHHIPKQRHRVTNWAAYDAALRGRGRLDLQPGHAVGVQDDRLRVHRNGDLAVLAVILLLDLGCL